MAAIIINNEDSSMSLPEEARKLAFHAVVMDGLKRPEFLRTLAWAYYDCADTVRAIHCMQLAIERSPDDRELYESELKELESLKPGRKAG